MEALEATDIRALGRTFRNRVQALANRPHILFKTKNGKIVKFTVDADILTGCGSASNVLSFSLSSSPHPSRRVRNSPDPPHTLRSCTLSAIQPPRTARFDMITAKPSHGIHSGSEAMQLMLELAQSIGFRNAIISDASTLSQCEYYEPQVSFKALLMLSRGSSWYDGSYGFTPSVIGEKSANVIVVHRTPVAEMRSYFMTAAVLIREQMERKVKRPGRKSAKVHEDTSFKHLQWYAARGKGCKIDDLVPLKRVSSTTIAKTLRSMEDFVEVTARMQYSTSVTIADILSREHVANTTCADLSMILEALFPHWVPGEPDIIMLSTPPPPKWLRASYNAAVAAFHNKRLWMSYSLTKQ